mgnify:CR=1 FL=1
MPIKTINFKDDPEHDAEVATSRAKLCELSIVGGESKFGLKRGQRITVDGKLAIFDPKPSDSGFADVRLRYALIKDGKPSQRQRYAYDGNIVEVAPDA